jgi:precorrin-2 methylase
MHVDCILLVDDTVAFCIFGDFFFFSFFLAMTYEILVP